MQRSHHSPHAAFSLVELSIALVVIGLLVGTVIEARSMIRASQVNSTISDFNRYASATASFRDQYHGYPGDLHNATSYWGSSTVDGDGDNMIDHAAAASVTGECFQFWNQLALSGLIKGHFSGIAGSGGYRHAVPNSNVPAGRIDGSGFYVEYRGTLSGNTYWWDGTDNNTMGFGLSNTTNPTENPVFTAEEAYHIDTKIDDGKPAYGTVQTYRQTSSWANCVTSNASDTADYNTTYTPLACTLAFPNFSP